MPNDSQLLAQYGKKQAAEEFQVLVERHIHFVYAAALRQIGNIHAAEDVTQAVFLLFSEKAGRLKRGTLVKGWLFNATRNVIANARRAEARRKFHEREAAAMRSEAICEDHWPRIAPHLDDAMAELPEKDRRVLLLRFYEDLPLADLGEAIGVSEQAAQKRVERALEHLRHFLVGRGAAVGAAALDGILRASAAQAAPAYLAKATIDLAFSGASTAAQSSAAFSLAKGTASLMAAAKTKTIAAIVVICLLIAPTTLIAIHYATSLFAQSPQLGPDPSTPVPTAGATRDIQTVYGLQNGEIIKRIVDAPPDVRKRFLQQQFPGQNNSTQVGHAFIGRAQDGFDIRFEARAYLLGSDYTFQNLVGFTSFARGISDPEFHIDAAIVNRRLTGDIVFKQDATDDEFCAGLAAFIHDQLAIEAAVVYRDVLMKVIVLSGHWKFTPVPQAPPTGKLANQCIEIYGDESLNRNSRSTGDNTTGRGHFARDLSDDLNQKVIIDVDRLPEYVSIRTYGTVPPEGPGRDLVLQHIQEQTGLTWTEEIRPVRCLLIETKKLAP